MARKCYGIAGPARSPPGTGTDRRSMVSKWHVSPLTDDLPMTTLLRPAGRLLDLALPPVCAGCGREGEAICPACLPSVMGARRPAAGNAAGAGGGSAGAAAPARVVLAVRGDDAAGAAPLKYAGERRLAAPLGAAVAERWRRAGAGGELLVPVPVHATRRRERGYDQAALIAEAAAATPRASLARRRGPHPGDDGAVPAGPPAPGVERGRGVRGRTTGPGPRSPAGGWCSWTTWSRRARRCASRRGRCSPRARRR